MASQSGSVGNWWDDSTLGRWSLPRPTASLYAEIPNLLTEDNDFHDDPAIRSLLHDYGVRLVHIAEFLVDLAPKT
jgi:hypothetical protein